MTTVGAIQERRVWISPIAGWGVGAALALVIAYVTDVSSIRLAGNAGGVVYAERWVTVLRAAAFVVLGAAPADDQRPTTNGLRLADQAQEPRAESPRPSRATAIPHRSCARRSGRGM
jgi:hypothetical protein